jgi:hypothetical protein
LWVGYYRDSDLTVVRVIMADAISPQAFSDLIGSIYDCALDPSRWEQTLADVRGALDCQGLMLTLTDVGYDQLLLQKSVGVGSYEIEQMPKYLPEIHALLVPALASWPSLDEPLVMSRHLPTYFEMSRYYLECLKPTGVIRLHGALLDANANACLRF